MHNFAKLKRSMIPITVKWAEQNCILVNCWGKCKFLHLFGKQANNNYRN